MSLVYITKFNFSRMTANSETIGKGLCLQGNEQLLYSKRRIDWFTDLEASSLFLCKILLLEQDHVLFETMVGKRWLKIRTPKDDFTRAKAPKKPAFHQDVGCTALHADFVNFKLPVGFKEIYGEARVQDFRAWLDKEGWKLLADSPERFQIKCEAMYPRVQWANVVKEVVRRQNSGVHLFHNFNLAELEDFIHNLYDEFQTWCATLSPSEQAFVSWCKQNYCAKDTLTPEQNSLLDHFKTAFKWQMMDALRAYYYVMAEENGLHGVNQSVLESLGFAPCQKCTAGGE